MAESIFKLKVDSQEYDSKIKRATQGLVALGDSCRNVGQSLNNISKENLAFVQNLGKMETVSKTARGSLGELTAAFTDLSVQYNRLTEEEKKGEYGRALAASLEQIKTRAIEAKQELAGVERQLGGLGQESGGGMQQLIGGIAGKFGMSASMFTGVGAAIAGIGAAVKLAGDNIRTAMGFESSMSRLSSLTGMVGKDLEKLKEYAIELGSTTTLSASQVADAFRLIGSQQPQLLSSGEALKEVTKYAITLSEAAGIDLATAAQTLSTSINQMGGDSNNAARFVNVLAAASQKGAGDIAWLGEALVKSATAAKAVGTGYEELVANLEQLAKAGFDASTAGTALRSIIMNLEKQANNDFKPSVVGLTTAFENLGKAQLDITGYQEIVGKMFATQAMALANAADEARRMTDEITGTNIAESQAKTNTDNLEGSLKSLASAWEGLNLHINSSNGLLNTFAKWGVKAIQVADRLATDSGSVAAFKQELQQGGSYMFRNSITGVKENIDRLGGSKYKDVVNKEIVAMYKKAIQDGLDHIKNYTQEGSDNRRVSQAYTQAIIDAFNEYSSRAAKILHPERAKGTNVTSGVDVKDETINIDIEVDDEEATKSIKQFQDEIKKLKKLRDEAADSGDTEMRDKYNAQIKNVQTQIKAMRGSITSPSTHQTLTNPQKAQQKFDQAEKDYNQALDKAALELKAGTITQAEYKKKEYQAQEALWKSIGDAREIYDSPKLKEAQDKAAEAIVKLGAEVRAAADAQKEQEKYARELANAEKKLSDAQSILSEAQQKGELGAIYKAQKQVDIAQQKVKRIESIKINVEQGKVDMPDVPTDDKTIKVNVEQGTIELPDIPKEVEQVVSTKIGEVITPIIASDIVQTISTRLGDIVTPDIERQLTQTIDTKVGEVVTPEIAEELTQIVDVVPGTVELPDIPKPKPIEVSIKATTKNIEAAIAHLKEQMGTQEVGSVDFNNTITNLVDFRTLQTMLNTQLKNGMTIDPEITQNLFSQIFSGIDIEDSVWEDLETQINEGLGKIGIAPISIKFSTGEISKEAKETQKAWSAAASAINSASSAMQNMEDPAAKVAGIVMQAIANIALGFSKQSIEAAGGGPLAWIAATLSGLAVMTSTIAAIKSATKGGFAEGGIVPGNSYSGDLLRTSDYGINSGELILNRAQQNNIASQLENNSMSNLNLTATVYGEQIRLALNNGGRRTGRGEYVQSNYNRG